MIKQIDTSVDAKQIQSHFKKWTQFRVRGKNFSLNDNQLHQDIYLLFGSGALTTKIVESLMALLQDSQNFPFAILFERLENFYQLWSSGYFIDQPPASNYPQKTLAKILTTQSDLENNRAILGLRQVDVYAGLNVMILLLELHRYGQVEASLKEKLTFYPCGQPNTKGEAKEPALLSSLIDYSNCLGTGGFRQTVGSFLIGANLIGANLGSVNLHGFNLKNANLRSANLDSASLRNAILDGANLRNANLQRSILRSASLKNAILDGTNLKNANLRSADLRRAILDSAILTGADLSKADLRNAYLDSAILTGADLDCTDLRSADLAGADLAEADLSAASLKSAILASADLAEAEEKINIFM